MACSVGMLLCNKSAIHAFPVPCTLVSIQFLFTGVVVLGVGWNAIHIGSAKDVLRWCKVIPFFSGMILSSILALANAPMTLVITMRALSPLTSLPIERCFPNPIKLSPAMMASLAASLVGAVVYISGMEFNDGNKAGVAWAMANNLLAVGDRLLQRLMLASDQDPVDISTSGVTLLNNVLGVVPLLVGALCTQEFAALPEVVGDLDAMKLFWVISSCFVGAGISYTGVWVASLISATSFLVLINANKFFIIFLEAFVLKSKDLSATQIAGATISILAGVAYGKARDAVHAAEKEEGSTECMEDQGSDSEEGEKRKPLSR